MQKNSRQPTRSSRICARLVDYCLFFGMGLLATLAMPFEVNTLFYLIFGLSVPLLFAPLEAALLRLFGTTLGKALFGISMERPISFSAAFQKACIWKGQPGSLKQKQPSLWRLGLGYAVTAFLLTFSILSQNITNYTIGFEKQQKRAGWVHYVAEEAGFNVNFPSKPQMEEKAVKLPRTSDPVNITEYTSQKEPAVTYSVSYIDLPKKWSFVSSKRILKGVLGVVLKLEPESELISKEHTNHRQYGALDFHYMKGEDEVMGRLIRVGQRLFKLTVTYPKTLAEKPVASDFIESFEQQPK